LGRWSPPGFFFPYTYFISLKGTIFVYFAAMMKIILLADLDG
jgi:hypothetical protein